ncbi:MAG: hypothetical protein Kow00124_28580 [Anaerolineae bacterium]
MRQALEMILRGHEDIRFSGEASGGAAAVALCAEVVPDVVIMDLVMPHGDGVTATRTIHKLLPQTKVLILTGSGGKDLIQAALEAGASDYLMKDAGADMIISTIRRLVADSRLGAGA